MMKEKNYAFLKTLEDIIEKRKETLPQDSYTAKLFQKGIKKIAQKVGEEASETILEAVQTGNDDEFLNETADLLYHLLVLLRARNFSLEDVVKILESRHKK
ncbi:MAG: phosphoribosyl-ATP diphosphatase [Candidatus Dadabacteria bacterium]|nr:MAG: phosphoribosyl-ATP diphosphatase [Candidatus Dadabacteria bacterium]